MTVECQLKLSRLSSHERTSEHRLQYDRFRTTLNKNWRVDRQQFYSSRDEHLQRR